MPHPLSALLAGAVGTAAVAGSLTVARSMPADEQPIAGHTRTIYVSATDKSGAAVADMQPADFEIKDGAILRKGQPHLQWKQACEKLPVDGIVGRTKGKAEAGEGGNDGVQFVKLAVDAETGVVHPLHVVAIQSCGKVIFRKGAESQVIGSVTQGLSNALFERQVLDRNIGTMLNDNLESYKIIGPYDMPKIETVLWTRGQTGVRGIGEPPIVATWGAVACAIFNAIGRPVRDMPMTPDRILAALEGAKA